ncbi:hypothetical protein OROHE_008003 [Orobanche hederae]
MACVHFNRGRYSEALELYKAFLDLGDLLVSTDINAAKLP